MGVFEIFLIGFATVAMATFARILGEDAKTFIPRISKKIIKRAANKLSAKYADRFKEEWLADLNDRPEMTSKLYHALSIYLWGTRRVGKIVGFNRLESFYAKYGKRMFDITFSSLGLILLLPVFAVVMILIILEGWWADKKGPIIFSRRKFSRNGKPFRLFQFRTIHRSINGKTSITRVGKFLRITSLDTLPCLLNLFIGEITLVGKRSDNLFVENGQITESGKHFSSSKEKPGLIYDQREEGVNSIQHSDVDERSDVDGIDPSLSLWSDIKTIFKSPFRSNKK